MFLSGYVTHINLPAGFVTNVCTREIHIKLHQCYATIQYCEIQQVRGLSDRWKAINTLGRVEVNLHAFLTSPLDEGVGMGWRSLSTD